MITVDKETRKFEFYKVNEDDKVWRVVYLDCKGLHAVSFDKKKILEASSTCVEAFRQPC